MAKKVVSSNSIRVGYENRYIILSLKDLHNNETISNDLRSVYVNYKIKAFNRDVQHTVSVKKSDIFLINNRLVFKIELEQLNYFDRSKIEIVSLRFNYITKKPLVISIYKIFSLSDIQLVEQIFEPKILKLREMQDSTVKGKRIKILEISKKINSSSSKTIKATPVLQSSLVTTEEVTHSCENLLLIEKKIECQLNFEVNQLEMNIRNLCFKSINLVLSNLPKPKVEDDYSYSKVMIESIQEYINTDLLKKEQEEGKK